MIDLTWRRSGGAFLFATIFSTGLVLSGAIAKEAAAGGLPADTRLVTQGDATLTLADIDAYMQKVPEDRRPGMMYSSKRQEELLVGLLAQRQLAAQARKLGLQDDPDVQRQIALATDEVLARARLAKARKDLKLPDFSALAQERYASEKSKYVVPGQIDVQHVLISTKQRSDSDAFALAKEAYAKAVADPAAFETLVKQYSDDTSKGENQGIIRHLEAGKYAEKFLEAVNALRHVGDVSEPVKTQFGYHVIKLLRHDPDQQKSFDEVRDEIVTSLRDEYTNAQVQARVDEVRNNKLDPNPEAIASLRTRYLPPGVSLPPEDEKPGSIPLKAPASGVTESDLPKVGN